MPIIKPHDKSLHFNSLMPKFQFTLGEKELDLTLSMNKHSCKLRLEKKTPLLGSNCPISNT